MKQFSNDPHERDYMNPRFSYLIVSLLMVSLFAFFIAGCGSSGGQLFEKNVPAKSLRNSMFDDPTEQPIAVYLPPTYASSSKRYPAVYVLTGFGARVSDFLDGSYQGFKLKEDLDLLLKDGKIKEMIVVVVNGRNFLGGSFYANSPVTGNWGDFVVRDVVRYVDDNYKTLPYPQSRGITGHEMGGYGAINLAMLHPDIFGTVYAISAGLFDNQGLRLHGMFGGNPAINRLMDKKAELEAKTREEAHAEFTSFVSGLLASGDAFDTMWAFSYAYGAAFSPEPGLNAPYIRYPYTVDKGQKSLSTVIWWDWDTGYGQIRKEVEAYTDNFLKLNAIAVDVGDGAHVHWVIDGNQYLVQRLREIDVPVDFVTHGGENDERHLRERMDNFMFPYFSEKLVFE
jgi:S-formylglutathione hydrolase